VSKVKKNSPVDEFDYGSAVGKHVGKPSIEEGFLHFDPPGDQLTLTA
jgi:hypothetical protein